MKANPILENNKINHINGNTNTDTNTDIQQKPVEEQVVVINNETFERVALDDRQLTIEAIEGSYHMKPPKEISKERVQVIENDIENRLTILTPFTTTSTSTSTTASSMTQVKELCAATVARQDVSESVQSDKQEYVCNKEIMSTHEVEVKPVKLIIARKRIHEDASSKKKQQKQLKKQTKTNKKVQQHEEVLAIVGKQAEEHKLTKVVPNEIPNVNVNVNAAYNNNTHCKERESGQVAFKGSCNEKSLLRNGNQYQCQYESSALTPKQIDKMQQNTPSSIGSWTFEHNNTNFCQQIQQQQQQQQHQVESEKKSRMDEKLYIPTSTELLVRVPLSALTPDFQQRLEKTQQLGLELLETKQEFTHGQAENEQLTKRQKMYVHNHNDNDNGIDDDDDDDDVDDEKQNNIEIDTSCLVDDTDQSDFSSLFDGAFATTEINKAPPNTPASVNDFNNQDCSYFIHENTSMNYSPINTNSIDDYIENFPTNFHNANNNTTSRKSLEREYEHDEHDLLTQLTTLSGNCLSHHHQLQQQQQQQQQHSMLSPSHMSEMQDVETTLNCILNEMQDQHIYTPVSSHTDDFLNQSVYSPLTEPPITPSSSLFPESPADDTLSTASSPSQNYYQQQKQQLNHQQQQPQPQQQHHASLPPAYMHDCFAEDSTQSELIGFQNNIPCFENIEQLSSPASMDSSMTKHQLQQQEQCLDIVHVKRKDVHEEENNNNKNCTDNNNDNNDNNNQNDATLIEEYLNINDVTKLNTNNNNNNNNIDSNNLRIVAELTTTTTTTKTTIESNTSNNELATFLAPTTITMEKLDNTITIDLDDDDEEEEEEKANAEEQQKKDIMNVNVKGNVNDTDDDDNDDDDDEMKNYAVEYVQLLNEFEARQQEHEFMKDKKCVVNLVDEKEDEDGEEEEAEVQLNEAKELIQANTSAIITTTTTTIEQQPSQATLTPAVTPPQQQPQQQQHQIIFSGQQPQQQNYQQSYHILQQQQQQHQQQQQSMPQYNVINLLQNTATGTTTATPTTTLTLNNGCINLLTTPTTTLTAQELQWNDAGGTTYYINTADLYRNHSHNQHMTSSTATAIEAGRGQASGIFDANALYALQQKQQQQQQQQQQLLFLQQQQQQQQQRQELQHYQFAQKLPERYIQQHAIINPNENYMQRLQHYQQQEHQRLQQQQQVMILTIPHKTSEHQLQHQQQQHQQHQSAQYETQDFTTTQTVYIQTPTQSTATAAGVAGAAAATNLIGSGINTTNLLGLTLHESHNNSENLGVVVDEGAACTTLPLTLQMTSLQQQQHQKEEQQKEELKQSKAQKRKPQKSKQNVTKIQSKKEQKPKQQQQEKNKVEDVEKNANNNNNNNNNNKNKNNNEIINLLCRFCYKRQKFTNNLDYSNHIIAMHPSETPYNCPYCPMHFTRRNKRQQHIVNQHDGQQFKCAACTDIFYSQRSLDIHLLRHHSKQRCLQQEKLLLEQEKLELEQMQLQQAHVQQNVEKQRKVVHLEERVDRRQGRGRGRGGGGNTRRGRGKGRTPAIARVADDTKTLDVWQTTDTNQTTTTTTTETNEKCK